MKKVLSLTLALVLVLGCFAACGAPATKPEASPSQSETPKGDAKGDTIKLGMIGCYTGDNAQYGIGVKNGATLYIDEINANGGINGKQIEIIAYDNKGD
ncbi:MAG: ABC transporter substrate-binding protein, partial [Oscillospiraceae bacterium]